MTDTHGYSGYTYDIFISYARDDNTVLPGETVGWVRQFHDFLADWLIKRRGLQGLKIWFDDTQLSGHLYFNDEIKQCIEQSALFLVLNSHNYRRSDYCKKELDWFWRHNQQRGGVRLGNQARLFNALLNNIPHQDWPPEFQGLVGSSLHDAPEKSSAYGQPIPVTDFGQRLRPLVDSAADLLEEIRQQQTPPSILQAATPAANKPSIFIAHVADTLKPFRQRLVREIGDKATVLSELPPPFTAQEHQQQLTATLEQAHLSVHLLDQWGGLAVQENADLTFPRLQASTAREQAKSSLLWVPAELAAEDMEDEAQKNWLQALEYDARPEGNSSFMRSSRQALVDQVHQLLDELNATPASSQTPARVLIDTHNMDQLHAFDLAKQLATHAINVEFTQESSDPTHSLENFERNVRQANHLVVVFGQVTHKWVKGRVQTAIKIASSEVDMPLKSIWVFALPHCHGRAELKFPPLFRVNWLDNPCADGVDPQVIERLLSECTEAST